MEHTAQHPPAAVAAAVDDLQRIAERLMALSEGGVAKGMTHTNGVDCLIGLVDRMDFACALAESRSGGPGDDPCGEPGDPTVGDLPQLCQDVRRKAADLDRLNRDGVAGASEVGEFAAELVRIKGELRRWLSSTQETPTA